MKKLISILLVFCMLLGLTVVPAVAEDSTDASAKTTIDYYKWDFSEEALYTKYEGTKTYVGENGEYDFAPMGYNGKFKMTHSTIDNSDALRVRFSGHATPAFLVPLKSDGTPFVMETGKSYSVKLTAYFKMGGSKSGSRYAIAPYSTLDGSSKSSTGCVLKFKEDGTEQSTGTWRSLYYSNSLAYVKYSSWSGENLGNSYTYSSSTGAVTDQEVAVTRNPNGQKYTFNKVITMASQDEFDASGVTVNDDGSYAYGNKNYNSFFAIALPGVDAHYFEGDDEDALAKVTTADDKVYSQIYTDYYITELEIVETGCDVTELYDGDTKIDVLTGEKGAQLPLYVPEAPEGKYFYGWYTDKELTTRCTDFTFKDGVTALYACFRDYIESYTEDFEVSKNPATQFSIYKSTEVKFPEGTAQELVDKWAKESVTVYNNTFQLNGYNANGVSGGVQVLKGTTYNRGGPLLIADDTASLFIPAPNTQYKVTVRARATSLESGDSVALQIGYGIGREDRSDSSSKIDVDGDGVAETTVYSSYFNSASTLYNTNFAQLTAKQSITEVTDDFVTYEFTVDTYELDEAKYQPAIGIWSDISGASADALNTAEIDSVTIEMVKTTVTLINGEEVTTLAGVPGEELNLPETGIIDTNWYTDYENYKVFTDTVFPAEDIELHTAKEYFVDGKSYLRDGMFNAVNTTDENGKEVPALLFDGTRGTSRGVYRFDKVADQVTYKLSFKYKLETTNKGFDISLLTSSYGTVYSYQMYVEGNVDENNNVIYKITPDNKTANMWYTAEIFFTANVNGTVTQATKGDDYTVNTTGHDALFLFVKEIDNGNDKMYMKDFVVTPIENALKAGGASVLIGEAEEVAGGQAIRYYFDYQTEDGNKIKLGDDEYEIVERGVIFRNGVTYKASNGIKERVPNSTISFRGNEKLAVSSVTDNTKFGQCWEYNKNTSTMRFSYYVYGFDPSDTKELMARGFITFKDNEGNRFTIYSAHINRSVAYMAQLY